MSLNLLCGVFYVPVNYVFRPVLCCYMAPVFGTQTILTAYDLVKAIFICKQVIIRPYTLYFVFPISLQSACCHMRNKVLLFSLLVVMCLQQNK